MNERDRKALEDRLDNPEFNKLYNKLLLLSIQRQQTLNISRSTPTRAQVREGNQMPINLFIKPRQNKQEITSLASTFIFQVERLARCLSKYFPEKKRDYWQEIFISMAFGAHSFIEQAQLGGRKKQDGISEKKAQEYEGIANDYYIYSKRGGTESQYANSHGISLSKLKRALAYMNSKKVSKNR